MKFDTDEPLDRAIPVEAHSAGSPVKLPRRRPRVVQSRLPAWLEESVSLLTMAAGLALLFLLWRAAAFVIRVAGGNPH